MKYCDKCDKLTKRILEGKSCEDCIDRKWRELVGYKRLNGAVYNHEETKDRQSRE